MKPLVKFIIVIIIAICLVSSGYVVFLANGENNDKVKDTEAPTIDSVTGDTEGTAGKIITITATFSDNVNVTKATLTYKSEGSNWKTKSILTGSAEISIPSEPVEDIYYFITADDEAGNGPVGDPSTDGSDYYTITVTEDQLDLTHYVFVEEGTTTNCVNCPNTSKKIHELYESEDIKFYYVSLIGDKTSKANNRLENDYNILGYPTVYVDGGYRLVVGDKDKDVFKEAIQAAENREVPKIAVRVSAEYNNDTEELTTDVLVKSYEEEEYTGTLKVYLVEKISRWPNSFPLKSGEPYPYHYGFLDFVIDEETSVSAGGEITVSDKRKLTEFDIPDLYPEELVLIAVMFSKDSVKQYSSPPSGKEFDAHYADAAHSIELMEGGDQRPIVTITSPVAGKVHLFGIPLFEIPFIHPTILIRRTKISAEATDDGSIAKVEFYIDDELINSDEEAPYEFTLKKVGLFRSILYRKHILTVTAYDDKGKTSSIDLEFRARI